MKENDGIMPDDIIFSSPSTYTPGSSTIPSSSSSSSSSSSIPVTELMAQLREDIVQDLSLLLLQLVLNVRKETVTATVEEILKNFDITPFAKTPISPALDMTTTFGETKAVHLGLAPTSNPLVTPVKKSTK